MMGQREIYQRFICGEKVQYSHNNIEFLEHVLAHSNILYISLIILYSILFYQMKLTFKKMNQLIRTMSPANKMLPNKNNQKTLKRKNLMKLANLLRTMNHNNQQLLIQFWKPQQHQLQKVIGQLLEISQLQVKYCVLQTLIHTGK